MFEELKTLLEDQGFEDFEQLFTALLFAIVAGRDGGVLIATILSHNTASSFHQLSYVIESLVNVVFNQPSNIITIAKDTSMDDLHSSFYLRMSQAMHVSSASRQQQQATNNENLTSTMHRQQSSHGVQLSKAVLPVKVQSESNERNRSGTSISEKQFNSARFNSFRQTNRKSGSGGASTSPSNAPLTSGKQIVSVLVAEITKDYRREVIEELKQIVRRKTINSRGSEYQIDKCTIVLLVASELLKDSFIMSLINEAFYNVHIGVNTRPNVTEILPSRKASPLIPAIQLEEFAFRAQQVYISSEMVKMLRDIVTGLRNDRRLRKGVSAQLALELVPICQLAALFLFKCDYLLPSHVEFILTRALSHRLTPKTTVRDMIEHNETVINDVFGSVLKYL